MKQRNSVSGIQILNKRRINAVKTYLLDTGVYIWLSKNKCIPGHIATKE